MALYEIPYTVARSEFDGWEVSTVSFPLADLNGCWFETLVWHDDEKVVDAGTRYKTRREAEAGHVEYVALVRSGEYGHYDNDDCECKYCHDAGEVQHPAWGSRTCPEPSIPCPWCGGL